jgi:hypothetical protein
MIKLEFGALFVRQVLKIGLKWNFREGEIVGCHNLSVGFHGL